MANLYDEALKGTVEIIEGVSDEIAKDFKGTLPFDKERVDKKDIIDAYLNLTVEGRRFYIDRYGQNAIEFFTELDRDIGG